MAVWTTTSLSLTLLIIAVLRSGESSGSSVAASSIRSRASELAFALPRPPTAPSTRATDTKKPSWHVSPLPPSARPLCRSWQPAELAATASARFSGGGGVAGRGGRWSGWRMVASSRKRPPSSQRRRPSTAAAAAPARVRSTTRKSGAANPAAATVAGSAQEGPPEPTTAAPADATGNAERRNETPRRRAAAAHGGRKPQRQLRGASLEQSKGRRTRGKAFVIVCDAESVTHPELLDCIDIVEELGTRDVGVIYADWKVTPSWRSFLYQRSKADRFKVVQRDPLPPGSNPLGDDTMTVDVMNIARSEMYNKYEFCLLSSNNSMTELAKRLRGEGRVVRGMGRRQAPEAFLKNCDAFGYIDPANRYELLMNEGLVMSVALCIALAAAGQERCDWVRMVTIVKSLHAWDLGLETPNWFGYNDYGDMVEAMGTYIQGVEDTSGEIVVKVPPKPPTEVPRGLEEVASYLHNKWVSFTNDPRMNDILLACIPACVQAVAVARAEMKAAVRRRSRRQGFVEH